MVFVNGGYISYDQWQMYLKSTTQTLVEYEPNKYIQTDNGNPSLASIQSTALITLTAKKAAINKETNSQRR